MSLSGIPKYKNSMFKLLFFPVYWLGKIFKVTFKKQFLSVMATFNRFRKETLLG